MSKKQANIAATILEKVARNSVKMAVWFFQIQMHRREF